MCKQQGVPRTTIVAKKRKTVSYGNKQVKTNDRLDKLENQIGCLSTSIHKLLEAQVAKPLVSESDFENQNHAHGYESSSDAHFFNGDFEDFEIELDNFIDDNNNLQPIQPEDTYSEAFPSVTVNNELCTTNNKPSNAVPLQVNSSNQADEDELISPDIFEEEKFGPKVKTSVVNFLGKACNKPSDVSKIADKYLIPSNCQQMVTPRYNKEIWSKLHNTSQTRDTQMQEVQKTMALGLSAFSQLATKLSTLPNFKTELRELSCDTMSMLGNAFNQITFKRKFFMRPSLPNSYHALCAKETPVTKKLFGDDLGKRVKDLNETNRAFMNPNKTFNNKRPMGLNALT